MARRKNNPTKSARSRKSEFSWSRTFLYIIPLIAIAALLIWLWPKLTSWAINLWDKTWNLFGWGLVIIAVAAGTLAILIWRRKLRILIYHWNQWLGSIAFTLVVWGILAFFNLGGSFGFDIISRPNYIGLLRILGLVILGIILLAPHICFQLTVSSLSWLLNPPKRQPRHRPVPQRKPSPPSIAETPKFTATEKRTVITKPSLTQTPQELKQVAQEVWRKYGQSPTLVTIDGWRLPPIDILDKAPEMEFSQADNAQRANLIEEALASYGVEAKVVQINPGPTVTQFGVEPGWDRKMRGIREKDKNGNINVRLQEVSKTRVKVDRITSLANDLALALAAPTLRIEAPVPGKSIVGIEVPNKTSSMVNLRGVIESNPFQKTAARSKLALALGEGAGGEAVAGDLAKMPHLLIAGATGSGKTVCLNSIICCLLLHNIPNDVKFIMIDPKRVELTPYNSIPHLATPVITDTNKALSAMRWLNQEMDKRYQKLAGAVARNIDAFNKNKEGTERLPYLILVIDELADLMMTGPDEVERILCRLAQLSRAVGIHLVLATQRPSVDVVTGLIKANFPTRISFAVTSQVDSRTILDSGGAEKLLGRGDMLYMPTEAAKPKRLQGCFVSDAEMERLVYFWGNQKREETAQLKLEEQIATAAKREIPDDPLLESARQLQKEHKHISTSYLQRKLRIGYPRAARIMEQLEEESEEEEGEEN